MGADFLSRQLASRNSPFDAVPARRVLWIAAEDGDLDGHRTTQFLDDAFEDRFVSDVPPTVRPGDANAIRGHHLVHALEIAIGQRRVAFCVRLELAVQKVQEPGAWPQSWMRSSCGETVITDQRLASMGKCQKSREWTWPR